jgi:hypothetical protein
MLVFENSNLKQQELSNQSIFYGPVCFNHTVVPLLRIHVQHLREATESNRDKGNKRERERERERVRDLKNNGSLP